MATRAPMRRIRSSSSSFSSPLPLPLEAVDVDAGDDAPLTFARLPLPPLPLLRGGRSASSRVANARDGPTRRPPAPPTIPSEQLFPTAPTTPRVRSSRCTTWTDMTTRPCRCAAPARTSTRAPQGWRRRPRARRGPPTWRHRLWIELKCNTGRRRSKKGLTSVFWARASRSSRMDSPRYRVL